MVDVHKISLFLLLLVIPSCQWSPENNSSLKKEPPFFKTLLDKNGKPKPTLLALLDHLNVQHDGSLESIVELTQKQWRRPPSLERWQVKEIEGIDRSVLAPYFERLGLLHEWFQPIKTYDYVIIFGAAIHRIRRRLAHFAYLWDLGVRPRTLVFLTGKRTLDPSIENENTLNDTNNSELPIRKDWVAPQEQPKTEDELMLYIFNQAELPSELRTIKPIIISAPAKTMEDGTLRRPSAIDTINAWLKANPAPGTCLAISNQPFIGYFHAVLTGVLPPTFEVYSTGASVASFHETPVAIYLDTLSRWLYYEKIIFDKLNNKS